MQAKHTILICDRNPHVREFLRRELTAEGYLVCLAKDVREMFAWVSSSEAFALVILDPDFPDAVEKDLLKEMAKRFPAIPVVVHSYRPDYVERPDLLGMATLVEKDGTSVVVLKNVISKILEQAAPQKSGALQRSV